VPAFRYEAADALGNTRKGVLNADSARAARSDLRSQGLVPIVVDAIAAQIDESGKARRHAFGDKLSTVELALFTRQLASLLEASLPLEQAFTALLEQAERVLLEDQPVIPLYFYVSKHLVKPDVVGWQPNIMDHHYSRYFRK